MALSQKDFGHKDWAHFVGNGTKVKIPSEIKPPLASIRGKKWQKKE